MDTVYRMSSVKAEQLSSKVVSAIVKGGAQVLVQDEVVNLECRECTYPSPEDESSPEKVEETSEWMKGKYQV